MADPIGSVSMEDLFRTLDVEGVLRYVADRRGEDLNLDFKLAPTAFGKRDDRKTLAKAISGFANASGGLIVWGVDARPGDDGVDSAQKAIPIEDPALFMSRLAEHSGGATSPSVDGVRHRLLEGPAGPFALSFVPESAAGPHMAKLGEDRYYKRSGDSFLKMEHFEVADMFGRRQRPDLQVVVGQPDVARVMVSIRNIWSWHGTRTISRPAASQRLWLGAQLHLGASSHSEQRR